MGRREQGGPSGPQKVPHLQVGGLKMNGSQEKTEEGGAGAARFVLDGPCEFLWTGLFILVRDNRSKTNSRVIHYGTFTIFNDIITCNIAQTQE